MHQASDFPSVEHLHVLHSSLKDSDGVQVKFGSFSSCWVTRRADDRFGLTKFLKQPLSVQAAKPKILKIQFLKYFHVKTIYQFHYRNMNCSLVSTLRPVRIHLPLQSISSPLTTFLSMPSLCKQERHCLKYFSLWLFRATENQIPNLYRSNCCIRHSKNFPACNPRWGK